MQYSNVPSAFVLIFKLNNAAEFFTNSEQFLYFTTIAFYHVNRYKIMPLITQNNPSVGSFKTNHILIHRKKIQVLSDVTK